MSRRGLLVYFSMLVYCGNVNRLVSVYLEGIKNQVLLECLLYKINRKNCVYEYIYVKILFSEPQFNLYIWLGAD